MSFELCRIPLVVGFVELSPDAVGILKRCFRKVAVSVVFVALDGRVLVRFEDARDFHAGS